MDMFQSVCKRNVFRWFVMRKGWRFKRTRPGYFIHHWLITLLMSETSKIYAKYRCDFFFIPPISSVTRIWILLEEEYLSIFFRPKTVKMVLPARQCIPCPCAAASNACPIVPVNHCPCNVQIGQLLPCPIFASEHSNTEMGCFVLLDSLEGTPATTPWGNKVL